MYVQYESDFRNAFYARVASKPCYHSRESMLAWTWTPAEIYKQSTRPWYAHLAAMVALEEALRGAPGHIRVEFVRSGQYIQISPV